MKIEYISFCSIKVINTEEKKSGIEMNRSDVCSALKQLCVTHIEVISLLKTFMFHTNVF